MATPALSTMLQPAIVNGRISKLRVINDTIQRMLGFNAGGPSEQVSPYGRRGSYDIFNDSRRVPGARLPATPAGTINRQPVGNVAFILPRSSDKMPITLEDLHNFRRIGGPVNGTDTLGEAYIAEQEKIMRQDSVNLREFQSIAMLRGSYTYTPTGDDFSHEFSGGTYTVDYQIPAGNKSKLDMLGAGDIIGTSWANAAAPIVGDLLAINEAFLNLCGRGLKKVLCDSVIWGYVVANTQVQNQAGSVNQPFLDLTRNAENETFTARLKAVPWLEWQIIDNVLDVAGTTTKLCDSTHAHFLTDLTSDVFQYWTCSEPVIENEGGRTQEAFGDYYYYRRLPDPARLELHALRNGMPVLKVPKAVAYGLVVY